MAIPYEDALKMAQTQGTFQAQALAGKVHRGLFQKPLEVVVKPDATLARPYGWIFFYEPKHISERDKEAITPLLKPVLIGGEMGSPLVLGIQRSVEADIAYHDARRGTGAAEITRDEATRIAGAVLKTLPDQMEQAGGLALKLDATMEQPYGWVFFWNTRNFLEKGDRLAAIGGNGPLLVLRAGGKVIELTTREPVEAQLERYEHPPMYRVPGAGGGAS
jgi:hypothetical protein